MKALDFIFSTTEKKKKVSDKEILRKIRVLVPARGADLKPPLGPTLGQFGINIKDFCDKFNLRTKNYGEDVILNTHITLFINKSYSFETTSPSVSFLVNEDDVLEDASLSSKYVLLSTIYKISKLKSKDSAVDLESFSKSVVGTLFSSKIIFVNDVFQNKKTFNN